MRSTETRLFIVLFVVLLCPLSYGREDSLRKIEESYLKEDYSESLTFCNATGRPTEKARTLYLTGLNYMGTGSPCTARDFFRKAYNETASTPIKEDASIKIGDAFYLEELYPQAQAVYRYFLSTFPNSSKKEMVLYKLACCSSKLGEWDELKRLLTDLKSTLRPSSLITEKVSELEKNGFVFTVQAGAFIQKSNAQNMIQVLKDKGYEPLIIEDRVEKNTIFKVICGKYPSKETAIQVSEALSGDGYSTLIYP